MSDRSPNRLWKYRTWSENTRTLIVDGEVYFATPSELNDPLECRWSERYPPTPEECDELATRIIERECPHDSELPSKIEQAKVQLRELAEMAKHGVAPTLLEVIHGFFCLSANPRNFPMWAHYAAEHQGICIGIRPAMLPGLRCLPVIYSENRPVLDLWDYALGNRQNFVDASRTKLIQWHYEEEWRTLSTAGVRQFPGCVDRVIIGYKATPDVRAAIREAVDSARHDIQILEASLSHDAIDIPGLD